MSKIIEYIYLGLAISSMIFMLTNYEALFPNKIVYLLVFMLLFSFIFAFRRTMRIRAERAEALETSEELDLPEEES